MILFILLSPLILVIGSGRCSVGAKSPLTGACGEAEAGGMWGVELRRAGYDAIIIEGRSTGPVYLWIYNNHVEIRDARPIWGSEIGDAMAWFENDIGQKRYRTALIGPGGEKMVHFANIIADCSHAFGRCGLGAVMGSKNLKGVVVKGSQRPLAADNEKILAMGSKKAAEIIGQDAANYAMQVKGLEIPYHEPRLNQGLSIHYSIHAVGADHVTGLIDNVLVGQLENWDRIGQAEELPPTELSSRKTRMEYELGLYRGLFNYLGVCAFMPWNITDLRTAVEAVAGWPVTSWKLMKAVKRGITLMRIFNLREGFTAKNDRLPERFYTARPDGPLKDVKIDPENHRQAQKLYYQMMGWSPDGVPTKACLVALGLEWATEFMA